jgi:hypothetical protein
MRKGGWRLLRNKVRLFMRPKTYSRDRTLRRDDSRIVHDIHGCHAQPAREFDGPDGYLSPVLLARNVFAVWFSGVAALVAITGVAVRWMSRQER